MNRQMKWMAAILLAAVASAQGAQSSAGSLPTVKDAWIRWLPGNLPAGGYLTVVNPTDSPVALTGASSDDYGQVSLHQSREQAGVSSMTPVDRIVIKPHSTLVLADEGYHLMLMTPKKLLKPGDSVRLELHFDGGPLRLIGTTFQLRSPDVLMSK
jgi:periplasmic copper chaperone A